MSARSEVSRRLSTNRQTVVVRSPESNLGIWSYVHRKLVVGLENDSQTAATAALFEEKVQYFIRILAEPLHTRVAFTWRRAVVVHYLRAAPHRPLQPISVRDAGLSLTRLADALHPLHLFEFESIPEYRSGGCMICGQTYRGQSIRRTRLAILCCLSHPRGT
jgi:hypothetical protein